MASPQKENGYTPIANELLEQILEYQFPRNTGSAPLKILLFIARKTYGYSKKDDRISLTQFEKYTKIRRPSLVYWLNYLVEANVLVKSGVAGKVGYIYGINKNYEEWKSADEIDRLVRSLVPVRLVRRSAQLVRSLVPITSTLASTHKNNIKTIYKSNIVANATDGLILTFENMQKNFGKKTMAWLAYRYLEAKRITLLEGETYDANKIAKGLAKVYNECKKDAEEAGRRILLGGAYFDSRGLDWTPEAVWRRWEDIDQWDKSGRPSEAEAKKIKQKLNQIDNNPMYE